MSDDELDKLRLEVAAAHGLPANAASFLIGTTAQEMKAPGIAKTRS